MTLEFRGDTRVNRNFNAHVCVGNGKFQIVQLHRRGRFLHEVRVLSRRGRHVDAPHLLKGRAGEQVRRLLHGLFGSMVGETAIGVWLAAMASGVWPVASGMFPSASGGDLPPGQPAIRLLFWSHQRPMACGQW